MLLPTCLFSVFSVVKSQSLNIHQSLFFYPQSGLNTTCEFVSAGQLNELNEDLGKVQKEFQSCQGNLNTLNKKLTYDM